MLSAAAGQLGAVSGGSREAQVESMSRSGALIPEGMTSRAEKMTFLSTQRERLKVLLTALDKEASDLSNDEMIEGDVERRMGEAKGLEATSEGMPKSRSGTPFERIEKDEAEGKAAGGSWMPWNYWSKPPAGSQSKGSEKGRSSGVDTGY